MNPIDSTSLWYQVKLTLIGVGLIWAITACGGAGTEPAYTIEMERGYRFTPAGLTIPAGATVAWHNQSDYGHTVTTARALAALPEQVVLPERVAEWESGEIYTGERWLYTFTEPGTYTYFCRHHQQEGMIGTITVVSGE